MAHKFVGSLIGIGNKSKTVAAGSLDRSAIRRAAMLMVAMVALLCLSAQAQPATGPSPYVPALVTASVSTLPTTLYDVTPATPLTGNQTNLVSPTDVAVDSCGNIYTLDNPNSGSAPVSEIPPGGGFASIAYVTGNSYSIHLGQDASRANLITTNPYGTSVKLVPLVGCVAQPSNPFDIGHNGNGALYYYYNPGYSTGDFLGNTYISTAATCCVTGAFYLLREVNNQGTILLSNQPKEIGSMAVDKLQNVYFITDGGVFELTYTAGVYAKTPLSYGNYVNPVGLSVDPSGNLYVADQSAGAIYEIPNEGTTGPNLADQFTVASGINVAVAVAVNNRGDMYFTSAGATVITQLTLGNANFNSVALGQSATRVLNLQFNAASTLTGFTAPSGDFTLAPQALGTAACTKGNPYGPTFVTFTGTTATGSISVTAASTTTGLIVGQSVSGDGIPAGATIASIGSGTVTLSEAATISGTKVSLTAGNTNCQIAVGFKPTTVGKQSSAVAVTYTTAGLDAKGNPTTITVTTNVFVEGIGQAALLTVDPGAATPVGSGLKSPAGAVVDHAGNAFVADPGNNSVTEFPAGGGAPLPLVVSLACPSVTTASAFSAPASVAVDGIGNVFVADTGNNRIVEVPMVAGALSPSGATLITCNVKAPASVAVATNGDLYVADTGDNTILVFPNYNGPDNAGSVFGPPSNLGVGLSAPLAVTVDGPGDVFIADTGNNQVLEYPLGGGQVIVANPILKPSGLATDTSGSLFVVDQGNFRVLRIPLLQGVLSPNDAVEVALGVADPYGVAVDDSSNLFVTDQVNGAAYTIARSQVALDFGNIAVGAPSNALPLTIESAGNLPLVFSAPYITETGNTGDFTTSSPTGACADGLTLPVGSSCDLSTTFTPTVSGSRSVAIVFASNAANAPQLTLTGVSQSPSATTTTLAFTPAQPGAPFYGEPLSFTATVVPASGTGTPTGLVAFIVDGTTIALLPVTKGVATLPLNSGLTGGVHTVYAVYKGDASNNGSSSAVLPLTILKAPTTPLLTVLQIPWNNPYSVAHSNLGSCALADTWSPGPDTGNAMQFFAVPNTQVKFQAQVTSAGVGVPSGTLTFYSDGKLINGTNDPITKLDPLTGLPAPASSAPVLPETGGIYLGTMSTYGDTLETQGNAPALGENNVLVGPHTITVSYSGDQNYLPSTSSAVTVIVTDVSPTEPILTTPLMPDPSIAGNPLPACIPASTIVGPPRPQDPSTFIASLSATDITATGTAPGTTTLTIASLSDWQGIIDFACTNLPQYTTCNFNPGQITLSASTLGAQSRLPTQVALTITTNVPPVIPTATLQSGFFWLGSVLLGLLTIASRRRFRRAAGALTVAGFALLLFAGISGLSGCGSSTATRYVVTKPGTYQIGVVLTGSQTGNTSYMYVSGGFYHETFRNDLPYPLAFTLNVK